MSGQVERAAQMGQGGPQCAPAMYGVAFRPEEGGQLFARVSPLFYRQINEEGQHLTGGKSEYLFAIPHF